MKASYDNIKCEVTLNMSLIEYLNLQRIMRNINGSGDGFIHACQLSSKVSKVTTLVFDDELKDTWKYPALKYENGNWEFVKGGK